MEWTYTVPDIWFCINTDSRWQRKDEFLKLPLICATREWVIRSYVFYFCSEVFLFFFLIAFSGLKNPDTEGKKSVSKKPVLWKRNSRKKKHFKLWVYPPRLDVPNCAFAAYSHLLGVLHIHTSVSQSPIPCPSHTSCVGKVVCWD